MSFGGDLRHDVVFPHSVEGSDAAYGIAFLGGDAVQLSLRTSTALVLLEDANTQDNDIAREESDRRHALASTHEWVRVDATSGKVTLHLIWILPKDRGTTDTPASQGASAPTSDERACVAKNEEGEKRTEERFEPSMSGAIREGECETDEEDLDEDWPECELHLTLEGKRATSATAASVASAGHPPEEGPEIRFRLDGQHEAVFAFRVESDRDRIVLACREGYLQLRDDGPPSRQVTIASSGLAWSCLGVPITPGKRKVTVGPGAPDSTRLEHGTPPSAELNHSAREEEEQDGDEVTAGFDESQCAC